MLEFSDERWAQLTGGYKHRYDPRPALADLSAGKTKPAWDELWMELYHQDDIGTASLVVVPHLVQIHADRGEPDWQTYSFVGSVELVRGVGLNADLPSWLVDDYEQAWRDLVPLALKDLAASEDASLLRVALGVVALARGARRAGQLLLTFTDSELEEMMAQYDG
tara:strand:+ start:46077 stop:46571 length:495 start_codon:yes stop_codon:yes gene_type:complete